MVNKDIQPEKEKREGGMEREGGWQGKEQKRKGGKKGVSEGKREWARERGKEEGREGGGEEWRNGGMEGVKEKGRIQIPCQVLCI